MWINDKILWEFTEKSDFRRGVMKKPIYRGDYLKKGAWTVCSFKRRLGEKERDGVFERC